MQSSGCQVKLVSGVYVGDVEGCVVLHTLIDAVGVGLPRWQAGTMLGGFGFLGRSTVVITKADLDSAAAAVFPRSKGCERGGALDFDISVLGNHEDSIASERSSFT